MPPSQEQEMESWRILLFARNGAEMLLLRSASGFRLPELRIPPSRATDSAVAEDRSKSQCRNQAFMEVGHRGALSFERKSREQRFARVQVPRNGSLPRGGAGPPCAGLSDGFGFERGFVRGSP